MKNTCSSYKILRRKQLYCVNSACQTVVRECHKSFCSTDHKFAFIQKKCFFFFGFVVVLLPGKHSSATIFPDVHLMAPELSKYLSPVIHQIQASRLSAITTGIA